jgi:NADPH-dependent ferric siderophore reductase
MVRDAADAMFRAAAECCHQHDRASRIHAKASLEAEVETAQRACEDCDGALQERVEFYETTANAIVPTGDDEAWWHCANALWLASREYLRRHGGCDSSTKNLKDHSRERLNALHTEYELEASALLALRQAAEGYKRLRPSAA